MSGRRFKVVFEHDEGGWHVFIPEVKGCRTWGRSLGAARKNIREALSTCVDVFKDAEKVAAAAVFDEDVRLPKGASRFLDRLQKARDARAKAEEALRLESARAAKALAEEGLSLRDAGDLLGVSQEQVRQLAR